MRVGVVVLMMLVLVDEDDSALLSGLSDAFVVEVDVLENEGAMIIGIGK